MNERQTARYDAGSRVQTFNATNATAVAAIDGYDDEETDLDNAVKIVKDATTVQEQDNKGVGTNKDGLQRTMATTIAQFSQRGFVKVRRAGNLALQEGLSHPMSYYMTGTADEVIGKANTTVNLINDNLGVLTNILPADVTTMQGTIGDFSAVKDEPTVVNQAKKVDGTDQIDPALDDIDAALENMGYLIHSYFPGSTMAESYDLTSKLIILGIRHNVTILHLVDSVTGLPITEGSATTANGKKTENADSTGAVTFGTMQSGFQTFIAKATGYVSQNVTTNVLRGTHTEVVVMMVKG
jgi:hypothetical protein